MTFKDLMNKRYSARDYENKQIPENDLKEIIETASLSPSWANTQPWNVYIATGDAMKSIHEKWIEQSSEKTQEEPYFSRVNPEDFGERGVNNMNKFLSDAMGFLGGPEEFGASQTRLYNAPSVAYLTVKKSSPTCSLYDLGAFSMSLLLAAAEKDIYTVVANELVKYPKILRDKLSIPDDEDIVMGIAMGYASENKLNDYRSSRMELDEILNIIK